MKKLIMAISLIIILGVGIYSVAYMQSNIPITYDGRGTDVYELQRLPGIGEKRAEDIIAYRRANGPFRIPEELTEVPGIGEGILEGLIDYVTTGEENR